MARSDTGGTTQLGGGLSAQPDQTPVVSDISVAVDNSNRPVVAWLEPISSEVKVFVRRWNGTSWEALGTVPNPVANKNASGLVMAVGNSNEPVLAWAEQGTDSRTRVYVYRWNGTSWAALGNPLEAPSATISLDYPSLTLDSQDRPWVAVSQLSSNPSDLTAVSALRWTGAAWEQFNVSLRPNDVPQNASVGRSSLVLSPQESRPSSSSSPPRGRACRPMTSTSPAT